MIFCEYVSKSYTLQTVDCVTVAQSRATTDNTNLCWLRFTTDLPAGVSEMNERLVEEAQAGDLPIGSQVVPCFPCLTRALVQSKRCVPRITCHSLHVGCDLSTHENVLLVRAASKDCYIALLGLPGMSCPIIEICKQVFFDWDCIEVQLGVTQHLAVHNKAYVCY